MAIDRGEQTAPFRAALRAYRRFGAAVERRLPSDGSPAERRAVIELARRPKRTDAKLAAELGADRSSLSRTLTSLIAKGLVSTEPSTRHRSQRSLFLTPSGKELAGRYEEELVDAIVAEWDGMSYEHRSEVNVASRLRPEHRLEDTSGEEIRTRGASAVDYALYIGAGAHKRAESLPEVAKRSALVARSIAGPSQVGMGWIAIQGNRAVGSCFLAPSDDDEVLDIVLLSVESGARRAVAEDKLLDVVAAKAKEHTYTALRCFVSAGRDELSRTLKRNGFSSSDRVVVILEDGMERRASEFTKSLPM